MINWLNTNAGAVQGVGAIAGVLVAIAILVVTWRYVVLTSSIAKSTADQAAVSQRQAQVSQDQTEHLLALEERQRLQERMLLWARATYLLRQLSHLPTVFGEAPFARPAWRDEDELALERAAAGVDAPTVLEAAEAARCLENLRRHYARVRAEESPSATQPPTSDYLQEGEWNATKQRAHDLLVLLEAKGAGKR
jgi:hypothetical protein